jgi:hypothetical protein
MRAVSNNIGSWTVIVSEYSGRHLTHGANDKLVALSGIARDVCLRTVAIRKQITWQGSGGQPCQGAYFGL